MGQTAVSPEEGTVFNGSTVPGPAPGPFDPSEGDLFNGQSLQGPVTGGDSGGGGLGLGHGSLFPPNPSPMVPVADGGPLVLTAISPGGSTGAFEQYMQYNAASGGVPPYTWELVGGALPLGTEQLIFSNSGWLDQIFGNVLLQTGPYSYTLQVTDSSGIVSVSNTGTDTYSGNLTTFNGGSISTTAPNQLAMFVFISANEDATGAVAEITGLVTNGDALTFTRIFHDESFTYSDSAGNPGLPVATLSVDIFTAPASVQIGSLGWTATGTGNVHQGLVMRFAINGLADIHNPFDSGHSPSAFPNIATGLTGTASAPTNIGITTSTPTELLFGITLNHTTGGGGDASPAPDANGWVPVPGATQDNHGGSCGFSFLAANKAVNTIQNDITVTANFTDNFWYQAIFAFVGAGSGFQQTATATITGNVTPVVPGSTTVDSPVGGSLADTSIAYFIVPPFNFLMIEMFAGSDSETFIASTFGARFNSGGSETTVILEAGGPGAPPAGGPIGYALGSGSPAGHITFSWT